MLGLTMWNETITSRWLRMQRYKGTEIIAMETRIETTINREIILRINPVKIEIIFIKMMVGSEDNSTPNSKEISMGHHVNKTTINRMIDANHIIRKTIRRTTNSSSNNGPVVGTKIDSNSLILTKQTRNLVE